MYIRLGRLRRQVRLFPLPLAPPPVTLLTRSAPPAALRACSRDQINTPLSQLRVEPTVSAGSLGGGLGAVPTILSRRNCIILTMLHLRVVITAQEVTIFDSVGSEAVSPAELVLRDMRHHG
jgi:hypothetical protein